MPADSPAHTNRLAEEKSPYLLQHAHNPVDWYPWGEEAFAKARRENKVIFLSVGYSTCHWCHVMEHESFENPATAGLMNEHFVNIKVDREERPDVDALYMHFVQATTGQGGWPMSVWLTPELKPIVGGTYFPPVDAHGRAGFPRVLQQIAEVWRQQPEKALAQADQITQALSQHFAAGSNPPGKANKERILDAGYEQFSEAFDEKYGGFGSAPKFPRPSVLLFLHREYARRGAHTAEGRRAMEMSTKTLDAMARGGMYDHLGGGFHRYSVDRYWHIPHYEKMLYDQGQLALAYLEAFQITQDDRYSHLAGGILGYVERDLEAPDGGFSSAEDADSLPTPEATRKKEGAFYVWTQAEIEEVLGNEAELFNAVYGVKPEGNARPESDPHGELEGTNTLYEKLTFQGAAQTLGVSEQSVLQATSDGGSKLFEVRLKRPRPHLDDKILTAWNGLMIAAFARASVATEQTHYRDNAGKAIAFLRDNLMTKDGRLLRSYREGPSGIPGFADDYAFFIWGLIEHYQASGEIGSLQLAVRLQEKQIELFYDEVGGGFYNHDGTDPSVLLRFKEDHDGAEPSATSVSAHNLLRLAAMLNREDWRDLGEACIESLRQPAEDQPTALPHLMTAIQFSLRPPRQVILAGDLQSENMENFRTELFINFAPHQVVLYADGGEGQAWLAERVGYLKDIQVPKKGVTAHVCENFTCKLPVSDLAKFREQLDNGG
ncbi:MAG: thioredoxin domain-containing protein [Verrucomicrobiota bacterium]